MGSESETQKARMAAPPDSCSSLQSMLQRAVQSLQWTYTLFWRLCTKQGQLVWADGYYNGAIKTRKTVQAMEESSEEASLQRSQQLRDLYHSLSAGGDTNRRPSAALSPEDLTESEWFYLMCISFSFPPGLGVPGKAYARKQHVWITGANHIDSKTFSRAILAKSAHIKTVVCIPLMEGVVELGTTHMVKEDIGLIQHIKSIFGGDARPPKPTLSELSTSNSATSFDHCHQLGSSSEIPAIQQQDDTAAESDFETETSAGGCPSTLPVAAADAIAGEPTELMELELSEDIPLGSPDDASNNFDTDFHLLPMPHSYNNDAGRPWSMLQNLSNTEFQHPPQIEALAAEFTAEDTHYSHTVSTILQNQNHNQNQNKSSRWSDLFSVDGVTCSTQSAFSRWNNRSDPHRIPTEGTSSSQWLLKHILHNVPLLHTTHPNENASKSHDGWWPRGTRHYELSGNAERHHPEKLNEKFIILRSIVPFVTKMDKASILGDAIEYVNQLREKIQDLEAKLENARMFRYEELQRNADPNRTQSHQQGPDKCKLRILEGVGGGGVKHKVLKSPPRPPPPTSAEINLQVSIIETDGLLEIQCPYKEGLLLNIMQILQELHIETTAVQSSSSNGVFVAELRGKVKENMNGKKASIMEVKRAVKQILPHIDT